MDSGTILTAKLTYLHDVIDNGHGGYQLKGNVGLRTELDPQTFIMPSISTSYASEDYNDSMFSISAAESGLTGLNAYNADSGFKDIGASVIGTRQFNDRWSGTLILSYTKLLEEAADSPIVDVRGSEDQLFSGISINYGF